MSHSVVIYSTSSCHYCVVAKDFLRNQGISFTDYNVGLDPEKRSEMIELTGQMGVPVIVIDGQVMVGYNESRMRELLSDSIPSEKQSANVSTDSDSLWSKVKSTLGIKG